MTWVSWRNPSRTSKRTLKGIVGESSEEFPKFLMNFQGKFSKTTSREISEVTPLNYFEEIVLKFLGKEPQKVPRSSFFRIGFNKLLEKLVQQLFQKVLKFFQELFKNFFFPKLLEVLLNASLWSFSKSFARIFWWRICRNLSFSK